jgi:hypothetical protein
MRKLSSVLLPVAAVGALVASSLAVAGPAAADPWGHGYGRSAHNEHSDRAHGFDRSRHDSHGDRARRDGGHRYGEPRGR